MSDIEKVRLFDNQKIRTVWVDEDKLSKGWGPLSTPLQSRQQLSRKKLPQDAKGVDVEGGFGVEFYVAEDLICYFVAG